MNILFVGELSPNGRSSQRYQALRNLGHNVTGISYIPEWWRQGIDKEPLIERLFWKLHLPLDRAGVNRKLRAAEGAYNVIWIEKGNTIRPSTLRYLRHTFPHAKIVSCSEDDMFAWHNRTWWYTWGLPRYDAVFTTKVYNLSELKTLGAKRVVHFIDAFDPEIHRPVELSEEDRARFGADVSFVGTFEEDRAEKMKYLAEHGVPVMVWGSGWDGWRARHPNLIVKNMPVYGENFVKVLNATKINLGFLRKRNRDETTSRSVEIPACGAFLLAERTQRHEDLFEEGKEAEFFGSAEELLRKTRYYLEHEAERGAIALAGRERCIQSGYDQKSQVDGMLNAIFAIQ